MRFTVANKTWMGCIVIVGLGTAAMLVTYRGLARVQREMRQLAEVREPINWATHEMEINVNGIAVGTLGYLGAPDSIFRELVANDEGDFERFHADFLRLATTEQEEKLGETVGRLYAEFVTLSRELKAQRDRQVNDFADVFSKLEEMDELLDHKLESALDARRQDDVVKLEGLNALEADIAEVGMWVADYRWSRRAGDKALIVQNADECRATIERLKKLDWAPEDQRLAVQSLDADFESTMLKVWKVLADEDEIQKGSARFIDLREAIDAFLDEQIQPLAVELLHRPRTAADAATASMVSQFRWLISIFVATAGLATLALTRAVTRPLKTVARGINVVRRGNLAHRLSVDSSDEFADLAAEFNRMVARLQETLVSKERLEKSEQELKQAVESLREEISGRIEAEAERMRLQASLRRAQTLSAIGTLVAGVAHQVRNPLFGISSVLDAMEARLGPRAEYRRYMPVLREQVDRLTTLMQELMEYGRPGAAAYSAGAIAELVHETVKACQGLAEKGRVTVAADVDQAMPAVTMDRTRLSRALECLLENAIQHSSADGTVTISARVVERESRGWVEVRVEDGGPGFKEDELANVFEPFFTRRAGGTGLGLALVERIVENHGGQVVAANGTAGGAVLTVKLPVERSGTDVRE